MVTPGTKYTQAGKVQILCMYIFMYACMYVYINPTHNVKPSFLKGWTAIQKPPTGWKMYLQVHSWQERL